MSLSRMRTARVGAYKANVVQGDMHYGFGCDGGDLNELRKNNVEMDMRTLITC